MSDQSDEQGTGAPRASGRRGSEGFTSRMQNLAALVAAATALVTAVAAFRKPPDTRAPEQTYDELSAELKKVSEDNVKTHDDLVALRGFLDGYLASVKNGGGAVAGAERPPPRPPAAAPGAGHAGAGTGSEAGTPAAAARHALPVLGPRPKLYQPRRFDELLKR